LALRGADLERAHLIQAHRQRLAAGVVDRRWPRDAVGGNDVERDDPLVLSAWLEFGRARFRRLALSWHHIKQCEMIHKSRGVRVVVDLEAAHPLSRDADDAEEAHMA